MAYPKYSAYKDSKVQWLGNIPQEWEVRKLKYNSKIKSSNIDKNDKDIIQAFVINYNDVVKQPLINNNFNLDKTSCNRQQFQSFSLRKGDIIVTKDSMDTSNIADIALINFEPKENLVCGYHLYIIKFNEDISKFSYYLLSNKLLKNYFLICSKGTTIIGLGSFLLSNVKINIPRNPSKRK